MLSNPSRLSPTAIIRSILHSKSFVGRFVVRLPTLNARAYSKKKNGLTRQWHTISVQLLQNIIHYVINGLHLLGKMYVFHLSSWWTMKICWLTTSGRSWFVSFDTTNIIMIWAHYYYFSLLLLRTRRAIIIFSIRPIEPKRYRISSISIYFKIR